MGCPRCDRPLEAYTLRGSQAARCDHCGWVGISASLGGGSEAGSTGSWDDDLDDGDGDDAPLDALDGMDTSDIERLRTVGIRTVDELARVDPGDLADETGLPKERVRTHVRRAAIRVVTRGGDPNGEDDR